MDSDLRKAQNEKYKEDTEADQDELDLIKED